MDYEVRAGLSSVYNDAEKGWVADDIHSESASRTLDYACMSFFPPLNPTYHFLTEKNKQMTTMLFISWLYTLENLKPSSTSCMKELCVHPFRYITMQLDSWKREMRMGLGLDQITDGRKVCIIVLSRLLLIILFWFTDKGINGLIHSMWCMIYPS